MRASVVQGSGKIAKIGESIPHSLMNCSKGLK
jgi:hypothetical protein